MNKHLIEQLDDVDIVPYTKADRLLSWSILLVVIINLLAVVYAMIWGS